MRREVRSGCPYCGVGCGLVAEVSGGRLQAVRGDDRHPVNSGRTCQKPIELPLASRSADRATTPLWRDHPDGRFEEAPWEELMPQLARRLLDIRHEHGPGSIAFYVSGQLLTEDYYVVNKLAKGFLGTNNVDSNSRLCMSSAVAAYDAVFGADGPPPSYADIEQSDCFLLLGSNTAACHPILWARIRERQAHGARVIVADPRRTPTADAADLHLALRPGTDAVLLNALLGVVDRDGMLDREYLAQHVDGHEEMLAGAARWTPERAARVCGVPVVDIEAAAHHFAGAGAALALWSMGVNQSVAGTRTSRAIVNLCLATGHIGRPGSGPLSLTGQPNAMGGREVGGLAHMLPGYRKVASAEDRRELERLWALPPAAAGISSVPGLPATDLFDALEDGRIRAVWICGTNPVVSMPDAARTRAALARAELVVVQDAYHPTETSALAHAVLPAAQWPEKQGTMTNSERRVSLIRKAIEPPGAALPDWEIFARLASALGFEEHFAWRTPAAVYDEFAALTAGRPCDQAGLSHARLEGGGKLAVAVPEPRPPRHRAPLRRRRLPHPLGPRRGRAGRAGRAARGARRGVPAGPHHRAHRRPVAHDDPHRQVTQADGRRAGAVPRDHRRRRTAGERGRRLLRARELTARLRNAARAGRRRRTRGNRVRADALGRATRSGGCRHCQRAHAQATDPVSRQPGLKASAVRVEPAGPGLAGRQAVRTPAPPRGSW